MGIQTSATVTFPHAPEKVFEHIGDPTTHGAWSAKAPLQVTKVGDGPIGVGTEFTSTSKFLGKEVRATLTITQYDPPKRIAFTANQDGDEFGHDFQLEDKDGGTIVTRTVTIPEDKGLKGLLAKIVAPGAIRKEATKALERLRAQI